MEEQKKELVMTRVFDAPKELVFKAWTEKELVATWWGPDGVTNTINAWEVKLGGKIDLVMVAGEELGSLAGQHWPMTGEFEEVEEPSRLVFTANAIIDNKEVLQDRTTVSFEEKDGKTIMTVHTIVIKEVMPEAKMALQGMEMGWSQQLDKLVSFIKTI